MKLTFNKIGLRNIKTALAVFVCMLIFSLLKNDNPFYACIAAVICMGDTVENSVIMGKNRIIGTIVGGLVGVLFMFIGNVIPIFALPTSVLTGLGIVAVIFICTTIDKAGSVSIACIVFIGIMITYTGTASYHYALYRTIDTAIGIIVAILINKYINPPNGTNNSN